MKLSSLTLSDGRTLGFAEYGKADGIPVFRFHGTPGCHLITDSNAELVQEIGLRFIVPDRPGYGRSDFHPDRTLLDWADDVLAIGGFTRHRQNLVLSLIQVADLMQLPVPTNSQII